MILYYTHNSKPRPFTQRIYDRHRDVAQKTGQKFKAVVAEKFGPGDIVIAEDSDLPTYADIFVRVLKGLTRVPAAEVVYLVEDDVLYPLAHFAMQPREASKIYFNMNFAFMDGTSYFRIPKGHIALSQIFGTAKAMRWNFKKKLAECRDREMAGVEPAGRGYMTDTHPGGEHPPIDIRNGLNATWQPDEPGCPQVTRLPELPGWAPHDVMWPKYCGDLEA